MSSGKETRNYQIEINSVVTVYSVKADKDFRVIEEIRCAFGLLSLDFRERIIKITFKETQRNLNYCKFSTIPISRTPEKKIYRAF